MSDSNPEEEFLFAGHTHAKILVKPIAAQIALIAMHVLLLMYLPERVGEWQVPGEVGLVLHSILGALSLWYVIWPALQWWFASFEITDRRVSMRWGVLYKHSREIHLDRITQINEERGIIDRIFGAGTIVIHDAANASAIRFHDVPKFRHVRRILDGARHDAHVAMRGAPVPPHLPGDIS